MELTIEWNNPIKLQKSGNYYSVNIDSLPTQDGVYIFGRKFANNFEALYVGKGSNIRSRVKGQFNNLQLMTYIKDSKSGKRVLIVGILHTKPGQKIEKCLRLVERGLIRHFLSEGHDLVNKQGTRIRRHEIKSTGKLPKKVVPEIVFLEKAKKE